MKKLFGLLGLLFLLSFGNTTTTQAQVVVKVRPARPAVVLTRPAKARTGHIWVDGHWRYNNRTNQYVWVKGHWKQARAGHNWVAGRWVACTGGHKWVAGYWAPTRTTVVAAPARKKAVVVTPRRKKAVVVKPRGKKVVVVKKRR